MERKSLLNNLRRPTAGWAFFFLITWLWASWWMGDTFRVARENSFFSLDDTLMHGLLQQPFGWLWMMGRAGLTLFHWPLLGGLLTALLLTLGSWALSYCLRRRATARWQALCCLPAIAWMTWVAWKGLNLYFQAEPGTTPGVLLLAVLACAVGAAVIRVVKALKGGEEREGANCEEAPSTRPPQRDGYLFLARLALCVCLLLLPFAVTHFRHPYQRPFARMQVQLLHEDWTGIAETALDHAELSYRPLAADYAIALVHTGHLTDALFEVRMDFDSLHVTGFSGESNLGTDLYLIDCNFHAGLFRAATHRAMEHLTMSGPTLFSLKHLTRLALLDYDWELARKYLFILRQTPFEGDFIERYAAMVGNPQRIEADPVFARLRLTEPVADSFESQYQAPTFLGYTATLTAGRSREALMESLMANLYSKRMPDFLMRCEPLVGSMPPRSIAEGLLTQAVKTPALLQAFPQLQMNMQLYQNFIRNNAESLKDRPANARRLFNEYRGYYPYYYFFGNLKATRKRDEQQHASSSAGVN